MYTCVGFWDGDFGAAVVDVLTNYDGHGAIHGATTTSIAATVDFLAQWDYGDDDHVVADTGEGTSDSVISWEGYTLTYNAGLGYVALYRPTDMDEYAGFSSTCILCGEYIDYCAGHGEDARDAYIAADQERDSLMANLETMTEGM